MADGADTQENTDQQDQNQNQDQPWHASLSDPDLRNNPTLQKYNSAEEAHKGHLELQKTMGQERIVWPKDEKDPAWEEINKRMGIPETADDYGLDTYSAPEGIGVETFDRFKFQELMKEMGVSKDKAGIGWKAYTEMISSSYATAQEGFTSAVENTKAEMMKEYGETYEAKIQRGQAAIDALATTKPENDYLTAVMAKDPIGMKMMAKLGDIFAEHSVGGFQEKAQFTLTPAEARKELDAIKASKDYTSDDARVRTPLVERANELMKLSNTAVASPAY